MKWLASSVLLGCITGLLVVSAALVPPLRRAVRRRRWTRLLAVALGLLVWAPLFLYRGYLDTTGAFYRGAYPFEDYWDDSRTGVDNNVYGVNREMLDNRAAIVGELWRRWIAPRSSPPCRAAGDVCRLVDLMEQADWDTMHGHRVEDIRTFFGIDLVSALVGGATAWVLVRPGGVDRRRSRHREAAGVLLRLFLASAWLTVVLLALCGPLGGTLAMLQGAHPAGAGLDVSLWPALWAPVLSIAVGVLSLVGWVVTALLAWRARRAARSAGEAGEGTRDR